MITNKQKFLFGSTTLFNKASVLKILFEKKICPAVVRVQCSLQTLFDVCVICRQDFNLSK
jgi:hypothetical protein